MATTDAGRPQTPSPGDGAKALRDGHDDRKIRQRRPPASDTPRPKSPLTPSRRVGGLFAGQDSLDVLVARVRSLEKVVAYPARPIAGIANSSHFSRRRQLRGGFFQLCAIFEDIQRLVDKHFPPD